MALICSPRWEIISSLISHNYISTLAAPSRNPKLLRLISQNKFSQNCITRQIRTGFFFLVVHKRSHSALHLSAERTSENNSSSIRKEISRTSPRPFVWRSSDNSIIHRIGWCSATAEGVYTSSCVFEWAAKWVSRAERDRHRQLALMTTSTSRGRSSVIPRALNAHLASLTKCGVAV